MEVDLLSYKGQLNTRAKKNVVLIWDPVRKQYFDLTPEEMVRQLLILYLNQQWHIPFSLMAVEKTIEIKKKKLRFDLVVYERKVLRPLLLAELKKPDVPINQKVFDQLSAYQHIMQCPFLLASNGRHTSLVETVNNGAYRELKKWPEQLKVWS